MLNVFEYLGPTYRAVWIVDTYFIVATKPGTYSIAHRLLTAASAEGRTGWVEEVTSA